MADEKFFLHPESDWQHRYEALRASFVDRMPAKVVADEFSPDNLLVTYGMQYKKGLITPTQGN